MRGCEVWRVRKVRSLGWGFNSRSDPDSGLDLGLDSGSSSGKDMGFALSSILVSCSCSCSSSDSSFAFESIFNLDGEYKSKRI